MKYKVLWMKQCKKLTKFMTLAISVPVAFLLVVRFFKMDMSMEQTFEHISILQLPLLFLGIFAFSAVFSFLISLFIRSAAVQVVDGMLVGRNYWYFKRRVPIHKISRLYPFSNNGISAIVADAGLHGSVYISTHTEELEKLIEYLKKQSGAGDE